MKDFRVQINCRGSLALVYAGGKTRMVGSECLFCDICVIALGPGQVATDHVLRNASPVRQEAASWRAIKNGAAMRLTS